MRCYSANSVLTGILTIVTELNKLTSNPPSLS